MSLTLNRTDSPVRTVVYISINACNNTMYMSLLAQCKPSRYFDTGSQLPRRHSSVLPAETRLLCVCLQTCVHQCTCKCVCVCVSVHTVCVFEVIIHGAICHKYSQHSTLSLQCEHLLNTHALCMPASVSYIYCVECLVLRGNMVGVL